MWTGALHGWPAGVAAWGQPWHVWYPGTTSVGMAHNVAKLSPIDPPRSTGLSTRCAYVQKTPDRRSLRRVAVGVASCAGLFAPGPRPAHCCSERSRFYRPGCVDEGPRWPGPGTAHPAARAGRRMGTQSAGGGKATSHERDQVSDATGRGCAPTAPGRGRRSAGARRSRSGSSSPRASRSCDRGCRKCYRSWARSGR